MRCLCLFAVLSLSSGAHAHGGLPRALHLEFFASHPGTTWILTDNQGLFVDLKDGFRWLCEDAIAPSAGLRGLQVQGADGQRWSVATTDGLFESSDMGCSFERREGLIGAHTLVGLWTTADGVWLTGSATVGSFNDMFWSEDAGLTWQSVGLRSGARMLDLSLSPAAPEHIILHTTQGLYGSVDSGRTYAALPIEIDGQELPGELILKVVRSPVEAEVLVLSLSAGARTRLVRSGDAGLTWSDVSLLPEPGVELAFDNGGGEVLAFAMSGLAWRSIDAGRTWNAAAQVPPTLGCLSYGPSGRLWGCTDPYRGGPWVLAHSEDFGRTWQAQLDELEESQERWDCGPNDRGMICCRGLCPGEQEPQACGQPRVQSLPEVCHQPEGPELPTLDLGAGDMNLGAGDMNLGAFRDAGIQGDLVEVSRDIGPQPALDQEVAPKTARRQRGCSSGPSAPTMPTLALLVFAALLGHRSRSP